MSDHRDLVCLMETMVFRAWARTRALARKCLVNGYDLARYLYLFFLVLAPWQDSLAVSLTDPFGPFKEEPQSSSEMPSARNLGPQWWDYFHVPPEQLSPRVEALNSSLEKLLHDLDTADAEAAKPLVARIGTNLKGYSELLLSQKKLETPNATPIKERYTVDEYLNVMHRLQGIEGEVQDELSEERQLSRALAAARATQDALVLSYRDLPERSSEKLLKGLELMANRISLAYTEQKLHLALERGDALETKVHHMQEELKAVPERLVATPTELEDLELQIDAAQKDLAGAQDLLGEQERRSLQTFPDNRMGTGRAQLATQKWCQHA